MHNARKFFRICQSGKISDVEYFVSKTTDMPINTLLEYQHPRTGQNPLHVTCRRSPVCPEIVRWLCDHGANLNAVDNDMKTPLHWACTKGCHEGVRYMIDKGAQTDLKDKRGRTAFELAVKHHHPTTIGVMWACGVEKIQDLQTLKREAKLASKAVAKHTLQTQKATKKLQACEDVIANCNRTIQVLHGFCKCIPRHQMSTLILCTDDTIPADLLPIIWGYAAYDFFQEDPFIRQTVHNEHPEYHKDTLAALNCRPTLRSLGLLGQYPNAEALDCITKIMKLFGKQDFSVTAVRCFITSRENRWPRCLQTLDPCDVSRPEGGFHFFRTKTDEEEDAENSPRSPRFEPHAFRKEMRTQIRSALKQCTTDTNPRKVSHVVNLLRRWYNGFREISVQYNFGYKWRETREKFALERSKQMKKIHELQAIADQANTQLSTLHEQQKECVGVLEAATIEADHALTLLKARKKHWVQGASQLGNAI
eukprot:TRINITY_DN31206_c0_g1_i1.p1 TRINITY_DN31206_c0_g1~~TRINITY_DN31206_c0_g1_i1.p1  ORF type:complete len:479 (+),score=26.17 TRINITY_DN31206_c0_g1_i1:23-1459(+)